MWKERGYFCIFILNVTWTYHKKTFAFKHSILHLVHKAADNTKAETWPWGGTQGKTWLTAAAHLGKKKGLCQSAQHFQNYWLKSLPGVKHPRVRDFQKEWLHRSRILDTTATAFFRATLSICTCHNPKGQWPEAVASCSEGFHFNTCSG